MWGNHRQPQATIYCILSLSLPLQKCTYLFTIFPLSTTTLRKLHGNDRNPPESLGKRARHLSHSHLLRPRLHRPRHQGQQLISSMAEDSDRCIRYVPTRACCRLGSDPGQSGSASHVYERWTRERQDILHDVSVVGAGPCSAPSSWMYDEASLPIGYGFRRAHGGHGSRHGEADA